MTPDTEDRSTWPRNGQVIRRDELLRLIEENGGPQGLDLRGAVFVGDGDVDNPAQNPIDLRPEALQSLAAAYRERNGGREAPWLHGEGRINLGGAQLQGAFLWNAQLHAARLGDAQLHGVKLGDAQLQGADLEHAQLQGANLTGAGLQGADFFSAYLQGADLWSAQLQGAIFWDAQLQGLDMYDASSLDSVRWDGALLDHTRIKRDSLGNAIGDELHASQTKTAEDYHGAKEAYLLLKNNFNQIGRYEDASWAYVKEQQMEKMAFYREHGWRLMRPWWRARWWRILPRQRAPGRRPWPVWLVLHRQRSVSLLRWLRNWAYELLTGYGEHPWRPALWAVFVIAVFAAIYAAAGNIAPDFAGDPATAQGSHHPLDALTHSIAAFATIGFNALEPLGWGARLLTAVESALGIGLFALFIFTIGNRMSRG